MLDKVRRAISLILDYDIQDGLTHALTRGRDAALGFHMYRSLLSGERLKAYDEILAALAKGRNPVPMSQAHVTAGEMPDIVSCVLLDHPELYWVREDCRCTYSPADSHVISLHFAEEVSLLDLPKTDLRLDQETRRLLSTAASLKTDADRVKLIHDHLTRTVRYGPGPMDQTAYAGLVLKRGVCAAYSKAFLYCLQKLGISAACLKGRARGEDHMWNLVRLDDEFYAMDVTWDDPIGKPAGTSFYKYFNVTDSEMEKDHARSALSARLPRARGRKYGFDWFRVEEEDSSR